VSGIGWFNSKCLLLCCTCRYLYELLLACVVLLCAIVVFRGCLAVTGVTQPLPGCRTLKLWCSIG
jgi:hypothetical protein